MVQLLSLAASGTMIVLAIMTIVSTARSQLPYIARALGADGIDLPPRQSTRSPRPRIMRPLGLAKLAPLRIAA